MMIRRLSMGPLMNHSSRRGNVCISGPFAALWLLILLTSLSFSAAAEDGETGDGGGEGGDEGPQTLMVGPDGHATISSALAAARPGDTIVIAAGTYAEKVVVNLEGVTLASSGEGAVLIEASNLPDSALVIDAADVAVIDVTTAHAGDSTDAAGVWVTRNGERTALIGVTTHSNGVDGFHIEGAGTTLRDCASRDNGMAGISLEADDCTVEECELRRNAFGVVIHSEGNVVANNSIYHSESYSVHVGAPGNRVESNDIYLDTVEEDSIYKVEGNVINDNPIYYAYDPEGDEEDAGSAPDLMESPAFLAAIAFLAILGVYLMLARPILRRRAERDALRKREERKARLEKEEMDIARTKRGRKKKKGREGPRRRPRGRRKRK